MQESSDAARMARLVQQIQSARVESVVKSFNKHVKGTEKFWRPSAV